MGLMYWQINDIWQAPTWSTVEYGLKWKMSHYYVRHMYESIYLILNLNPYLANATDSTAELSIYLINDLFENIQGELMCSIYSLDRFSVRLSFLYPIEISGSTIKEIKQFSYELLMKRSKCDEINSSCALHCSFQYANSMNQTQFINQTLFFNRPKFYQLSNPNLQIEGIKQLSTLDYQITLTAALPALFIWLDIPGQNHTGYFSKNGFHMFQPSTILYFHAWKPLAFDIVSSNFDLRLTSLYDIYLP